MTLCLVSQVGGTISVVIYCAVALTTKWTSDVYLLISGWILQILGFIWLLIWMPHIHTGAHSAGSSPTCPVHHLKSPSFCAVKNPGRFLVKQTDQNRPLLSESLRILEEGVLILGLPFHYRVPTSSLLVCQYILMLIPLRLAVENVYWLFLSIKWGIFSVKTFILKHVFH